jgi:hypothetical protein
VYAKILRGVFEADVVRRNELIAWSKKLAWWELIVSHEKQYRGK